MTRQTGFTLVETIVVVLMFAVGVMVISQMFLSQNRLYRTSTAELGATGSVRISLDDIDNYVRQATATAASYGSYTASSTTLILQIQSVDSNDRLVAASYDYVVYYLDAAKLTRVVIPNASSSRASDTKVLASNISNLEFTLDNADYSLVTEVDTSVTASEGGGVQTRTYTGSTKSRLRN